MVPELQSTTCRYNANRIKTLKRNIKRTDVLIDSSQDRVEFYKKRIGTPEQTDLTKQYLEEEKAFLQQMKDQKAMLENELKERQAV
ncbi:MAG TPA: hypothetical protein PKC38_00560 [Chitinophagales bacterium]|nr:hypothetical protein [Chitinophagales bacterium]